MTHIPDPFKTAFLDAAYNHVIQSKEENPHCKQLKKEYDLLFRSIETILEEKHKSLLFQLETVQNELRSLDNEYLYFQGMADCTHLLQIMKLI